MRLLSTLPVLTVALAAGCTNVNDHAWSGGGTHYASGSAYTGPKDTSSTDSGDTAGDTAAADTGAVSANGLTAISSSCAIEDDPNIGLVIHCTSEWADEDIALLTGGTIHYNLLTADGTTSLTNGELTISETADGTTPVALLDGNNIDFGIQDIQEATDYIVYFYAATSDGAMNSEELKYDVSAI